MNFNFSSINLSSIISFIVIGIVIGLSVMALLRPQKKKVFLNKNDYEILKLYSRKFNSVVNNYIETIQDFAISLDDIRSQIIQYRDREALTAVSSVVNEYNEMQLSAEDAIECANECMKDVRVGDFVDYVNSTDEYVYCMQNCLKKLSEIVVLDCRVKETYANENEFEEVLKEKKKKKKKKAANYGMFFSGVDSREALDKRYKALTKAFHPDNGFGDMDTFVAIKTEYEALKKRYA